MKERSEGLQKKNTRAPDRIINRSPQEQGWQILEGFSMMNLLDGG
jgi:hypothetical protein